MRTANQLNKVITKLVKKWKTKLRLWDWTISTSINTYLQGGENNFDVAATTDCDWRYMIAKIRFSMEMLGDMEEPDIERIVVHELTHILVNEMRNWNMDHEERVVSQIANVFEIMSKS